MKIYCAGGYYNKNYDYIVARNEMGRLMSFFYFLEESEGEFKKRVKILKGDLNEGK